MIFKDYYKILGLNNSRVSLDEIKTAYREQAKKYHPDVNVGDKLSEERFKDINEAYRVLSEANALGIGPMGLGGRTTLLGVKASSRARLPASFFVTVAYMCWACCRRVTVI